MTGIQKLLTALMPEKWARSMREESLEWMLRCTCGHEVSIWEAGGVRWKASGNPARLMRCPGCGQVTLHSVRRRSDTV